MHLLYMLEVTLDLNIQLGIGYKIKCQMWMHLVKFNLFNEQKSDLMVFHYVLFPISLYYS